MLVFDFEVFRYDWLVVFKDTATQEYHTIVNDRDKLMKFYERTKLTLHVGFNNKRYDNLVYRAMLDGADPYRVNQLIIEHDSPFSVYQKWNLNKYWYPSMDVGQDTMRGSLKEFEGYLGLDIDESSVPFDIDRPLTEEEIQRTIGYCKSDVDATEHLVKEHGDGLQIKMHLSKEFELGSRALDKTNAQLVAEILGAQPRDFGDEFKPFPFDNHTLQLPTHYGTIKVSGKEVRKSSIYDFYNKAPDYSEKLHIDLGGVETILAYGGIHGAKQNYQYEGKMWLLDVKQYYPNIMIQYDYLSRAVPKWKRKLFAEVVANRDVMRAMGEHLKSEGYKLISNTAFGASKAKFNNMYDPHNANNICISGQLMLVDLIQRVLPYCELIQANTDGILVIPHDEKAIRTIVKEWETTHRLTLDIDVFKQLYQKDVNNYIAVEEDNSLTVKGGMVSQTTINGHKPYTLRKTGKIIDDAVVNYLVNGIIPEHTIGLDNNALNFQIITKTGKTFDNTIWQTNSGDIDANKVNRVYATTDRTKGMIYKVRPDGRLHKVPNVPDHCMLSNKNNFSLTDLSRTHYIDMAWDRIQQYKGEN